MKETDGALAPLLAKVVVWTRDRGYLESYPEGDVTLWVIRGDNGTMIMTSKYVSFKYPVSSGKEPAPPKKSKQK